jgi:hypothetical protein
VTTTGSFAVPPKAERPTTPDKDYGVPAVGGKFVSWDHVIERLQAASAYWLATVTAKACPHAVPVWGVFVQDDLYLEIGSPATTKSRNLKRSAEIQVHLGDVDDVVIVRGSAEPVVPGPTLGGAIAAAMAGKYTDYKPGPDAWDEGGLARVIPRTVLAWHDMPTATRWRW